MVKTRLKTEARDVHLSQGIQQSIEDANAKEQCQTWVLKRLATKVGNHLYTTKVEVGHKRIDAKWKETTRDLPCLLFELSSLFENPDCPESGSKRLKKGPFSSTPTGITGCSMPHYHRL